MATKVAKQRKNFDKGDIRCFNCDGWGHKQNQCPSPRRDTKSFTRSSLQGRRPANVLHLKDQSREMSIYLRMCGAEVCAVLDSGARRSVLPLHHYNAIPEGTRPPLQLTCVETLHGVGPGDVPVLGEANIIVSINNREVEVDFLIADIAGH